MRTTFDSNLVPSFELTEQETQELVETGFIVTDDGYCVTMIDNQIQVFKEFEEYDGIKLFRK